MKHGVCAAKGRPTAQLLKCGAVPEAAAVGFLSSVSDSGVERQRRHVLLPSDGAYVLSLHTGCYVDRQLREGYKCSISATRTPLTSGAPSQLRRAVSVSVSAASFEMFPADQLHPGPFCARLCGRVRQAGKVPCGRVDFAVMFDMDREVFVRGEITAREALNPALNDLSCASLSCQEGIPTLTYFPSDVCLKEAFPAFNFRRVSMPASSWSVLVRMYFVSSVVWKARFLRPPSMPKIVRDESSAVIWTITLARMPGAAMARDTKRGLRRISVAIFRVD